MFFVKSNEHELLSIEFSYVYVTNGAVAEGVTDKREVLEVFKSGFQPSLQKKNHIVLIIYIYIYIYIYILSMVAVLHTHELRSGK